MERFEFDRDFMNTNLAISIVCDSFNYARSAAEDAFSLVSRIEAALSMYRDSSDVFAINIAKIDDEIRISDFTMDCLELGANLYQDTFGALDICMGQFFLNVKSQANISSPKRLSLNIDKENFVLKKLSEGFLDLGAIGKGYAVDKIIALLKDTWLIKNAFINFGSSTIFALGVDENAKNWTVSLNGREDNFIIEDSYALASSALRTQGNHIIDPMTLSVPECDNLCYYAYMKNSASYADAFSTAFLILNEEEISDICTKHLVKFLKI